MPQTKPVTLNYTVTPEGHPRLAQPPAIAVSAGDKIRFHRGSVPPGLKVTIIIDEPAFFSHSTFDEGGGDIEVLQALPHRVNYRCGLKGPDGNLVPGSLTGPSDGGQIDPDTGN